MKNKIEKLLKRSRLAKAYNELPNIQYAEKVEQEYMNLLKSSPCKDKMLYKHLTNSILHRQWLSIRFYKAMVLVMMKR
jgi:hypothetical protein